MLTCFSIHNWIENSFIQNLDEIQSQNGNQGFVSLSLTFNFLIFLVPSFSLLLFLSHSSSVTFLFCHAFIILSSFSITRSLSHVLSLSQRLFLAIFFFHNLFFSWSFFRSPFLLSGLFGEIEFNREGNQGRGEGKHKKILM